ncbi:MAG: hypothetical protein HWE37_14140 [Rhodobacteraceae bacterium]|nr:hypothetical protein [Paracoccaceae bacterium]
MRLRAACLLAVLAASPAQAETAAECAAFWQALAGVWRDYPGVWTGPDTALALVDDFRKLSGGAVAEDRIASYRLMHRYALSGDRQSADLQRRIGARCDALLPAPGTK